MVTINLSYKDNVWQLMNSVALSAAQNTDHRIARYVSEQIREGARHEMDVMRRDMMQKVVGDLIHASYASCTPSRISITDAIAVEDDNVFAPRGNVVVESVEKENANVLF